MMMRILVLVVMILVVAIMMMVAATAMTVTMTVTVTMSVTVVLFGMMSFEFRFLQCLVFRFQYDIFLHQLTDMDDDGVDRYRVRYYNERNKYRQAVEQCEKECFETIVCSVSNHRNR